MADFNDSFSQIISTNSSSPLNTPCFITRPGDLIFTSFNITNVIVLLPLSLFILHVGFQQWRHGGRSASSMSHSDCFAYHLAAMELFGVSGCILNICAAYSRQSSFTGIHSLLFTSVAEMFVHTLTSLDRYLAVVHPIVYMRLKNKRGIRNISVGCVWILSVVMNGLLSIDDFQKVLNFAILIPTFGTVFLCTVSVLCVLIRPGPGGQGRANKRMDPLKQRAFYTILAIQAPLALRFMFSLAWSVMVATKEDYNCVLMTVDVWIRFPSSLVLPLLFLHRTGKFVFQKK